MDFKCRDIMYIYLYISELQACYNMYGLGRA